MRHLGFTALLALAVAVCARRDGAAERTLPDYRYFRALSIDLVGRPPTTDELATFEKGDFDLTRWIDGQLVGPTYAERIRRIYMDLLRLEAGATYEFMPAQATIVRQTIVGPDGTRQFVYFRNGQRRTDPLTDGDFCFTRAETGFDRPSKTDHGGTPKRLTKAQLDRRTVLVKPWWLYADYRAKAPVDRYAPDWAARFGGYELTNALLVDADGGTPTSEVRVCREEAQTAETGHVVATGVRDGAKRPLPAGRASRPPVDTPLATGSAGKTVSCLTATGIRNSPECGCGPGLERCIPGAAAFVMPIEAPLGSAVPFIAGSQSASDWFKRWWAEEAAHFIDRILVDDRDFREVLLGRWTVTNGPLSLFYRSLASSTCCGPAADAGYLEPDPLVRPSAVPSDLPAVATDDWRVVEDRGPHAAGLLTMPVFLTKYASRRARAHVIYNAFMCREFIAASVKLEPSDEPDLAKRPGCARCHTTLEPMAAYFTRVTEQDWTWLPAETLPIERCAGGPRSPLCTRVYDPAFGTLRSAHGSVEHAQSGPIGLGEYVTRSPEFARCVVDNVAGSMLGRPLGDAEAGWKQQLVQAFVDGGYRMRSLVRALVLSPQYRAARGGAP